MPALKSDGWNSEPFELKEDKATGRFYGRGSTDDKGPVLGWLNVIEAHQRTNTELPVNLKMCFEGMEESGSVGLEAVVLREAKDFFKDVDAVCISDNYWLGTTSPCLSKFLFPSNGDIWLIQFFLDNSLRTQRSSLLQSLNQWTRS